MASTVLTAPITRQTNGASIFSRALQQLWRALEMSGEGRAERRLRLFMDVHGGGRMTPEIERNIDAIVSGRRDIRTFSPRFPKV